jgi:hypothetical protein
MLILSSPSLHIWGSNKIRAVFALTVLLILYFPISSQAEKTEGVAINEIAWMGSKITEIDSQNWWRYEWLELFNNTDSKISVDGWKIEFYNENLDWSLPLLGEILPNGYFLIVSSDKISASFNQNYSSLSGKMTNEGQKIILKDNSNTTIDEINCISGWFTGNNTTKQTMEKINPSVSSNLKTNWANSQNPNGTPGTINSVFGKEAIRTVLPTLTPVKKSYPGGIIFNEIMPAPKGSDENNEWIELYNQNNFAVNLSGWKIRDTTGATTTYTIPSEIKINANDFLVLQREKTKITLNNKNDGLLLVRPDGIIESLVNYENALAEKSYNFTGDNWFWGGDLTPGSANATSPAAQESTRNFSNKSDTGLASVKNKFSKNSYLIILVGFIIALISGFSILFLKKITEKRP